MKRKAVAVKQGEDIAVVSLRTSEKDTYNPQEVYIATMSIAGRNIINSEADAKTVWQLIYAKEYPKKHQVWQLMIKQEKKWVK